MQYRIGVFFLFFIVNHICMAETYHFVSIESLAEQKIGNLILPEIYKKLGKKITITPLPGKRAQKVAASGVKDGEVMRIFSYGIDNETLIRVPTPYYYLNTMAFTLKDSGIVINSIDDLKNYRLVKVMGVKHTDNITEGLSNVQEVKNTEQMMGMILKGRADVALTSAIDGKLVLKMLAITEITHSTKPLVVLALYHYINKTHINLVAKVDAVINEMQENGEMQLLIENSENKVLDLIPIKFNRYFRY